ncbi:MAG TPA: hypothetical protein DC048_14315, partial [Planctomycetaceae bacterium]|nr:hypothetical protein [Planctomycetaceae bacterium]
MRGIAHGDEPRPNRWRSAPRAMLTGRGKSLSRAFSAMKNRGQAEVLSGFSSAASRGGRLDPQAVKLLKRFPGGERDLVGSGIAHPRAALSPRGGMIVKSMSDGSGRRHRAFTLVELLVVIAI